MAPYFSVYPLPAKVGTNAAILASQHMPWTVKVFDGTTPVEVRVDAWGSILAITPVHGWPPDRALELVATSYGMEQRQPFTTASGPHTEPPRCDWRGPYAIHGKGPEMPPDMWPTNMPRPPANQRTFSLPPIVSTAGYLVRADLTVSDRGRTWKTVASVGVAPSTELEGGTPEPHVALVPGYTEAFTDDAKIVGMTVVDVAGNSSSYGET